MRWINCCQPNIRQKKGVDKSKHPCYNTQALRVQTKYRGVEQLEARRAHNPEVVGSSPASATTKNTGFQIEIRCFSNFWKQFLGPPKSVGFILGFTGNEPKIENRENRTFLNILKFDAERNSLTRGLCSFLFRLGIPPGKYTGTDICGFGFRHCNLVSINISGC